jgi:hypothetical protein
MTDLVRIVRSDGSPALVPWPSTIVPIFKKETISIPNGTANQSLNLDTSFVKYYVLCQGNGNAYAFEMNVFRTSNGVMDIVTNKLGFMNVTVVSLKNVSNEIRIEIFNNENYNIDAEIVYMNS